jgi:hypothetical protein
VNPNLQTAMRTAVLTPGQWHAHTSLAMACLLLIAMVAALAFVLWWTRY